MEAPQHSLDDLRTACLAELGKDTPGATSGSLETEAGLQIVNREGWLHISGTFVEFVPPDGEPVDVKLEVEYLYGDSGPRVTQTKMFEDRDWAHVTIPKSKHNAVAAQLMDLLKPLDQLAAGA